MSEQVIHGIERYDGRTQQIYVISQCRGGCGSGRGVYNDKVLEKSINNVQGQEDDQCKHWNANHAIAPK